MAGPILDEDAAGREQNEVVSRLDDIKTALTNVEVWRPPEKSIFPIGLTKQATHVRLRGYDLFISGITEPSSIDLHIGSQVYTFYATFVTPAAGNLSHYHISIPFPVLIDRGVDVWISGFDAVTAWLTYAPE